MSESNLWMHLRQKMRRRWEAERVENRIGSGMPDVAYTIRNHGWIELKFLAKATDGPVRVRHFTPEQRNWIARHGNRSGRVFVLMQIERHYLLFDHRHVFEIGDLTLEQLRSIAVGYWHKSIDVDELTILLDPSDAA